MSSPRRRVSGDGEPSSQAAPSPGQASSPLPYSGNAASTPGLFSNGRSSSPLPYGNGGASTPAGSIFGTPRRDIGTPGRRRELDLGGARTSDRDESGSSRGAAGATGASEGEQDSRTVIWGTDVNIAQTTERFRRFFREYLHPELKKPKYPLLLVQMRNLRRFFIDVDCSDLREFDSMLYDQAITYPSEVIPVFDSVVKEEYIRQFQTQPDTPIQVRTFNLGKTESMRALNPDNVDQLVAIRGMVIRTSPIIPDPKIGYFQCSLCKYSVRVHVDRGKLLEPTTCSNCGSQKSSQLVHNRCVFTDKQMIKLQETPENIPDGQTPQTTLAYVFDDLVDAVLPGDLVEVTGIYRATPLRINPRQRTVKGTFKTHIDVIHFQKHSSRRIARDDDDEEAIDPQIAEERETLIRGLAEQPNVKDRLAQALAPSIFGYEEVKRGILAMLFGGTRKDLESMGHGKCRGEINVLLCGDPGTSKSQLLQYAVRLAPRGMYTSGKGSSAVGLTAYVTKDPETKQLVLESGALVLCDGGICCIDEFDKMSDSTRSILHEAMEQQTVSLAKAGIIATLNARTSILAAANPQDSVWNKDMSIVENIQLPPTLLSRFDLIYLILDQPDQIKDSLLARHLARLYSKDYKPDEEETISVDILAQYISYARKHVHPQLTPEASHDLMNAYVEMRRAGNQRKTISATPRQLESLIRLSEAHARMRLSEVVEKEDVADAISLMKTALKQAATDPVTGLIDMDLITTGQSAASRHRMGDLAKAVSSLLMTKGITSILLSKLRQEMEEESKMSVSPDDLRAALERLEKDEFLKIQGAHQPNPLVKVLVQQPSS